jgi:hypothetical protein
MPTFIVLLPLLCAPVLVWVHVWTGLNGGVIPTILFLSVWTVMVNALFIMTRQAQRSFFITGEISSFTASVILSRLFSAHQALITTTLFGISSVFLSRRAGNRETFFRGVVSLLFAGGLIAFFLHAGISSSGLGDFILPVLKFEHQLQIIFVIITIVSILILFPGYRFLSVFFREIAAHSGHGRVMRLLIAGIVRISSLAILFLFSGAAAFPFVATRSFNFKKSYLLLVWSFIHYDICFILIHAGMIRIVPVYCIFLGIVLLIVNLVQEGKHVRMHRTLLHRSRK